MMNEQVAKIQMLRVLKTSWQSFVDDWKAMGLLSLVNYAILLLGFYSWQNSLFWLVLVVGYVFWSCFFRFYFKRKPYLSFETMLKSMVPSTKIVVLSTLLVTGLVVLPFIPLFLDLSGNYIDDYTHFLQKYMQETDYIDLFLNIILVVTSPIVFYRPFLAWISALLGRSGSLRSAWLKTRGNYWEFLLISLVINFSFVLLQQCGKVFQAPMPLMLFILSPVIVYFNIVLAKLYEFFFLETE